MKHFCEISHSNHLKYQIVQLFTMFFTSVSLRTPIQSEVGEKITYLAINIWLHSFYALRNGLWVGKMVGESCFGYFRRFVKHHIQIWEATILEAHGPGCRYLSICLSICLSIYPYLYLLIYFGLHRSGPPGGYVLKINFLHIKSGRFLIIWIFLLLKYQISQYWIYIFAGQFSGVWEAASSFRRSMCFVLSDTW